MVVVWGLAQRTLPGVQAIGVDKIQWRKGHKYLTLVYQIDEGCKRLLWLGQERREDTLESVFNWFGTERSAELG